ncbi:TetR/AcrR family transcriptional regulator [Acidobacteria bacterium AB60]|nr:TetR/AcrR family transcriptional regulator [Acidobacteria bacterium AB60]
MSKSTSREKFLQTTARLLRERGYAATGMNEIVAESGAPKGSLYFHFPGGKEEVASLALTAAADDTCSAIRSALSNSPTVVDGLQNVFLMVLADLEKSNYRSGCPVGTVASESPEAPKVIDAVEHAFQQWQSVIQERVIRAGLRAKRADEIAEFILVQFEGALVLAKARRDSKPLLSALREIKRHLEQEGIQ